ncbi:MAG: DJ-1/PfpI family protein [Clostridium sp.]|nr:DJ-1/PfpI family protein [Clostridium sp.]
MSKHFYVFLADGFEEIEALATTDILRRAGLEAVTVSINPTLTVTGAHGIKVEADTTIAQIEPGAEDWLIAPGGLPGATNLHDCERLTGFLTAHHRAGGPIAAICASPAMVLAPLGILDGCQATGYPGTTTPSEKIEWIDKKVVVCGNVITGNGPASTLKFALAIVAKATDDATAQAVGSGMLFYPTSPSSSYNQMTTF